MYKRQLTALVGAPWRGGAGTIEAVQQLAENISASFAERASCDAPAVAADAPAGVAQLQSIHSAVRRLLEVGVGQEVQRMVGDDDASVPQLIASLVQMLEDGLIGMAASSRLGLAPPSAWRVVKQSAPALHLPSAQTVAFVCGVSALRDDTERLRGWLRLSLNEGTLADALEAFLSDARALSEWYRPSAAVRNGEVASTLVALLAALRAVRFRLPVPDEPWEAARCAQRVAASSVGGCGSGGGAGGASGSRKVKRVAEIGKVPARPLGAAAAEASEEEAAEGGSAPHATAGGARSAAALGASCARAPEDACRVTPPPVRPSCGTTLESTSCLLYTSPSPRD